MKKATKKSLIAIGYSLIFITGFVGIALFVPDDSPFKIAFAGLMVLLIVVAIVFTTQLGNPIKEYFRNRKKNGE